MPFRYLLTIAASVPSACLFRQPDRQTQGGAA